MSQYYAQWKSGFSVIWRNLSWAEYSSFKQKYESTIFSEPMDIALEIYKIVLIKGPDPRFVPAGIPGFICKQQMISNPFSGKYDEVAQAIQMARKIVTGDYLLSAKAIISSTLNYRPEEIDNWDPNIFFIRLAQAEIASGRTFDPVDPKALKDKSSKSLPNKHKDLTTSQRNAIERTRERNQRG